MSRAALPVEFTHEALEDIEDLPAVARQLTRELALGRVACGQGDPSLRELVLGSIRVLYRVEAEQVVVLAADPVQAVLH